MTPLKTPLVPISWGELVDKMTILEIKSERIADEVKVANVRRELDALRAAMTAAGRMPAGTGNLVAELKAVNESLWDIEDQIRDEDAAGNFVPRFIDLARSVYRNNDRRARIKRDINLLVGSDLIEEKSYAEHGDGA